MGNGRAPRENYLCRDARQRRARDLGLLHRLPLQPAEPLSCGMTSVRIIKHEAIPQTGSYEVKFTDGRPSVYQSLLR
jgi:hypothetical protein